MDEKEKLTEALKTIKETCEKYASCSACPLSGGGECRMMRLRPDKWTINAPGEVWRALL